MRRRICLLCALLVCLVTCASAQDALTRWELSAPFETFHCAGVHVTYQGDQNQNATGKLEYRKAGEGQWRLAHPLVRINGSHFASSLFYLEPGTQYEVRVGLTDPDGAPEGAKRESFRTRRESITLGGGQEYRVGRAGARTEEAGAAATHHLTDIALPPPKEYWVSPDGDDNAAGTEQTPFRTVQHAADLARAGDTVWVKPGLYREEVRVAHGGDRNAYTAFRAVGEGVMIRGDDADFREGRTQWRDEGGGAWSAPCPFQVGYVAALRRGSGQAAARRLYHYPSLEDFRTQYEGVTGGWFYDREGQRLYLRMPEGEDPNGAELHVARRDRGFHLERADYVLIEGFDLGYFGRGPYGCAIDVDNSSNCVVRNNRIHHCRTGVRIRGERTWANLVELNEIYDTELSDWPWNRVKGTDGEGGGVSLRGGIGNVVRYNVIHGFFNGIIPSMWGDLENEAFNAELDVYENELYHIGDDPLEPEGACINQRFVANKTRNSLMGISIAPVTVGPCWVLRNEFVDFWSSSYKFSVDSSGPCLIYHNSAYTARPGTNGFSASGSYHGMVFRNNIVVGTRYAIEDMVDSSGNDLDYDCWYTTRTDLPAGQAGGPHIKWQNTRYNTLADFAQATGHERHGLGADPRFLDPKEGNLSLAADSPCIDAGMVIPNINDGYRGRAPDLGAREREERQ